MRNMQEFERRCRVMGASLWHWVQDITSDRLPVSYRQFKYLPKCFARVWPEQIGEALNWCLEPLGVVAVRQHDRVLLTDITRQSADLMAAWRMTAEESWRSGNRAGRQIGGAR